MICLFQFVEEPAAPAQSANKTDTNVFQKQVNDREVNMAHTKLENRKVAVDAIDESKEKNEKQELLDWKRSSVIKTSEGSQYNAEQYNAELNFFQFWGRNWRQFTSVLPGLVLLITFGFNAVFTIYELNKLNSLSEDISAPQKYYDSKNGNDINYPGRSVSTTSIYRNHDYYGTTARYDSYRGYRSSGSTHDDYGRTEGKPKLSLLGVYIVVIMWFIGAIIGNMLGASWIRKLKKRTNYVSFRRDFSFLGIFTI